MEKKDFLAAQLAALDITLKDDVLDDLLVFMDELFRWNRRVNLTAIRDPFEAMEKHLVDSLTLLPLLNGRERLLDLGSGGGFPGIPLKIVFPDLDVVTVDAVWKKIAFQRHAMRTLNLKNRKAVHARIEDLADKSGFAASFDVVVSRAFAALADFFEMAVPFLSPGGRLIAMKGAEGERELSDFLADPLKIEGFTAEVKSLQLPYSKARRTLIIFQKQIISS